MLSDRVMGVCPGFLSVAKTATLTRRDRRVGAVLVSPYASRSQSLKDKVQTGTAVGT